MRPPHPACNPSMLGLCRQPFHSISWVIYGFQGEAGREGEGFTRITESKRGRLLAQGPVHASTHSDSSRETLLTLALLGGTAPTA